jgi:hypothetical protein
MKMLVAIDGAGDVRESERHYEFRYINSWTRLLYERACEGSHYFQAERVITGDVFDQALNVASWVFENTSEDDEIAFVGYSRGGAACLIAASLLTHSVLFREEVRKVVALGLFDPVAFQIVADYHCSHDRIENAQVYLARSEEPTFGFPPIDVSNATIPHLEMRVFEGAHGDLGGHMSETARDAYIWIGNMLEDYEFINFSSP